MRIAVRALSYLSLTGKEKFVFFCEDCHLFDVLDQHYLYDKRLNIDKVNMHNALRLADAINNHTLHELSDSKRYCMLVYREVCNCDPNFVDPEYEAALERARELERIGRIILAEREKENA